ncbi:hypothetical protein [Novosphingobium sp.]|jgi:hypothetical protein|uniref:hypothetical protein n=1 Tax=Novosphingobium sp. TaxID=1874826 RepID=UPI0031D047E6
MKALATGRRVSKRPFCALSAALLVLVPGLARAAEPPCITPHEFNALSTYALPNALSATAQRCSASLPPDAFLKTGGPAMIARYAAGKPEAWPGARNVFLKLSSGQQGPVGDMLRAMPDPQLQQMADAFIQGLVVEKIPAERCSSLDNMLRLLSPLPAQSTADIIGLAIGLGSQTGQARIGKIQICNKP